MRAGRAVGIASSLLLHAGIAGAAWIGLAAPATTEPVPIAVRFIELPSPVASVPPAQEPSPVPPVSVAPSAPPDPPQAEPPIVEPTPVEPPKPEPVEPPRVKPKPKPKPVPKPQARPTPVPEPVAEAEPVVGPPPAPSYETQPTRVPEAAPAPSPAPAAAPQPLQVASASSSLAAAPLSAPRFDAEYLRNPAPAYPRVSRRLGEQGRVVLRVRVEPNGKPSQLEVQASSGSARLDAAALEAVRRWSFVAARRGNENVAAWVLVPMEFRLTDS